jgi:biotin-(acetyl-CoA carboxylase) ligase
VAERAVSLYQATGRAVDRLRVAAAVVRELDAHVSGFSAWREGFSSDAEWIERWKARCDMVGTSVRARAAGGRVIGGTVMDIDPLHGLVVRDESGAVHFLSAQTTSLSGEPAAG